MGSLSSDVVDDFLRDHSVIPDNGMFPAGAVFDDWRITAFVAKGGNGEVYRVENRVSGQAAALKVLVAASEAAKRERFLREAKLLGQLKGPHFPRLFATGEVDGHPCFVIEFLEPVELPKTDRAVAQYLLEVCEAVGAVHRLGYVHRDLKPQNILRREDGTLVLIDYGLVKPIAPESIPKEDSLSVVDGRPVGVGTPKYAAPEQFAGGEISPLSDIHALGILANECFGGNPPRIWQRIIARATSSIPARRFEDIYDFVHPIKLEKGEYRIEGPGSLSADLSGPTGTVVRLSHCIVTNRTEVAYPQNGIRYELKHLADLSFPNLSNKNRSRYIAPFDGKYNRVTVGKGARFEMSEQDMLNLNR